MSGSAPGCSFPLLVIAGPTASGKTSLAIALARRIGAEIVGADSMQVYRGMDVGTDTPSDAQLQGVPHHLLNVVDPDDAFNAAAYMDLADRAIKGIRDRGRRGIVVGGTGLYIRVLLNGLQEGPPPNATVRSGLEARAAQTGWPCLHRELKTVDPDTARRLHPNDGVRIVRALEVYLQSGKPLSVWQREHGFAGQRYPCMMVGVARDRAVLYERINRRLDDMMARGFIEEVRALLDSGYGPELKSMQGLGYKRVMAFLQGKCELPEATELARQDTRRYAKRQMTWFRKEPLQWVAPDVASDGVVDELANRVDAFMRAHGA